MTDKQILKLGKILKLIKPSMTVNMDIYVHELSKKDASGIIRQMPKCFRRTSKITETGHDWTQAVKSDIYGFGRLEITVFYPKQKKGGE